ncbi:MAG: 2-phosphosulfolactate phosphatase [Gemmatimonadota bacterium]
MKLDVIFSPAGLTKDEVAGRAVFVIDALRATTTACAALFAGARDIIPVQSPDEAIRMAQTLDRGNVLLAGERNCLRIEGFALGNSPLEMTESVVKGKTLVMTTTNGTRTLLACQGAAQVYLAAGVNLAVAGERARQILDATADLVIVCAGKEGAFALEDAYTAGRLVDRALGGRRTRRGLNDAALVAVDLVRRYGERWDRPFQLSAAGRRLVAVDLGEDIAASAIEDRYPVLPVYHGRRVTLVAPARPNGDGP